VIAVAMGDEDVGQVLAALENPIDQARVAADTGPIDQAMAAR
jgi:hypothetical protein